MPPHLFFARLRWLCGLPTVLEFESTGVPRVARAAERVPLNLIRLAPA
jgi:hypothetical protein